MRLAILAQGWLHDKTATINGTLVQLHNLAIAFAERGVEVHYIATTGDKTKPAIEHSENIIFHWTYIQWSLLSWRKIISVYRKALEDTQPNAVYVRGRNVFLYVAGKYSNQNKKVFVWGTNGDNGAELWKNTRRLMASSKSIIRKVILAPLTIYEDIFINKGIKMAGFIVNQNLKQYFETQGNLNREGIILSNFFLPVNSVDKKENLILWLATLAPFKQPEIFIDLISQTDLHGWKAIIGGGTTDTKYEKKVRSLISGQSIELIGIIPFEESSQYYQRARLYINTSKWEGLSNAFVQSWLSGTPVLSLNNDPNNWLNQKGIGFCANGDFLLLKRKLHELINDPMQIEVMGNKAREFAEKEFSDPEIINTYIRLFRGEN